VDVAPEISEGLALLQHRGQDACGIITCGPKGRFFQCKANGMVRDVFDENSLSRLAGGMGIGHGELISFFLSVKPYPRYT
jgi:amidophosphoribosyltransferase